MKIGEMRMRVGEHFVAMSMRVWLPERISGRVLVAVMFVMHVHVLVPGRGMNMFVSVPFCQMEVDTNAHEESGDAESPVSLATKKADRRQRSDERSG